MTLDEAIGKREQYKYLIGKQYKMNCNIRDVIVSDYKSVPDLYSRMYDNNMSNDKAIPFFSIEPDNYDVFIIAHQWSWGSGNFYFGTVDKYLSNNAEE